jgi:hypothetical protein
LAPIELSRPEPVFFKALVERAIKNPRRGPRVW